MTAHLWWVGSAPADDSRADLRISCHRHLRGPYTGLGTLIRAIVPQAIEQRPDLVHRYAIELLTVAPELSDVIPNSRETLTSVAAPKEQTRIYPPSRTRRIAHGVLEFLVAHLAERTLTVCFTDVDEADHTDLEFLAIALRRSDGARLRLIVVTEGETAPEDLAPDLSRFAERSPAPVTPSLRPARDADKLVQDYLESDGTSKDPDETAAYQALDPARRAELHDARAEELAARGERSLDLGAIPYHLERGSQPGERGGIALFEAANYCFFMGFHHALMDYGPRGRAVLDPTSQAEAFWLITLRNSFILAVLGRIDEAEPLYLELRYRYAEPIPHIVTGYALAILYARHRPPELRDIRLARTYLNNSLTIASMLPDKHERVFQSVFQRNGLALLDMREGDLPGALRHVTEGLARLNRELGPDEHQLHRSVLVYNRARVYLAMGDREQALADFDLVLELDPNYPDYYFDRASVRRVLGDPAGAMADYDAAISFTPPFYELHYNRADLRAELGDVAGAIEDFAYVVELEPDYLDARVNLVGLLLETEQYDQATGYVDEGLLRAPDSPELWHAKGVLAEQNRDLVAAGKDYDHALDLDPHLLAALVGRAALASVAGDHDAAIADLDTALVVLPDSPDLLYNRGYVHQLAGHWHAAVADYTSALVLPGADRAELLHQRATCHAELGELAEQHADLAELAGVS